jgi:hypothetical protein
MKCAVEIGSGGMIYVPILEAVMFILLMGGIYGVRH